MKKQKKMTKRKPTAWNIHLNEVYAKMKKEDSKIMYKDAMMAAKKTYKPKK